MGVRVIVRLFGPAREAVGRSSVRWHSDAPGVPLAALVSELTAEHPRLRPILKASRLAVNGHYVPLVGTQLADGDEVAVHPPFSGG